MPSNFIETLKGMPGLAAITDATMQGIVSMVVSDLAGRHRWPFLLKTQQSKAWVASTATQSFPGIARIISVMYPDSSSDYYRLEELSDIEFQKYIEIAPDATDTVVWRDAGMAGNKYQIELYSVPTAAKTLKMDFIELPANDDIDVLPGRFQSLVTIGVRALAFPEIPFLLQNYENAISQTIAREMDLQGKRDRVGLDPIQSARLRNAYDPS